MEEMIIGRNPVLEALRANRPLNKLFVSGGEKRGTILDILRLARERGVVVQEVDRQRLTFLAQTDAHQGVVAFAAAKGYVELEDILAIAQKKGEPPFLLLLNEIEDPHNFGSLLRTAEAAGVHGVVIPKRRAVGLTAAVSKAAAGAVEYMPVARVTNLAQTIDTLKKQGIWIVGGDMAGEVVYHRANLTGPIALVIGGEGKGLGRLIKERCDFLVRLPMRGKVSSLNAGVAGAILIYEIIRQREREQEKENVN